MRRLGTMVLVSLRFRVRIEGLSGKVTGILGGMINVEEMRGAKIHDS